MKERLKRILKKISVGIARNRENRKVFCIGYNKTGTTTLGKSFELLGYKNLSYYRAAHNMYKSEDWQGLINLANKFDSFDDIPWNKPDLIKVLMEEFKDAKFVFLYRDLDSWYNSLKKWKRNKGYKNIPDRDSAQKTYLDHEAEINDIFKMCKNRIIRINVAEIGSFQRLAQFLDKQREYEKYSRSTGNSEFPHFNKTSEMKKKN